MKRNSWHIQRMFSYDSLKESFIVVFSSAAQKVHWSVWSSIYTAIKPYEKDKIPKLTTMLDMEIYIFTLLTEAHTRMPKKPTRSTKSRITFLIFVHKLWFLSEVKRSSSSTSSNSSSSGSVPDKRAVRNREISEYIL